MKYPRMFSIELANHKLYVFDPVYPEHRIEVDQVVFEAEPSQLNGGLAQGYIKAVHGLPLDVAHVLPSDILRDLGVGSHIIPANRVRTGSPRWRATAGSSKFEKVSIP